MAMGDGRIVWRSLTSRLFPTLTTILMVAVAVGLLVSLLSLRESGRRALERGVGNAHLLVAAEPGPMNTVLNHLFFANPPRAAMPYAEYERLRDSHPWAWTIAMAQGDSFRGYPVAAVAAELFDVYQPIYNPQNPRPMAMQEGAWLAPGGEGDFQVVLGAEAARTTGVRVGQGVYLTHGVGARAATGGDVTDLDAQGNPVGQADANTDLPMGAVGRVHTEYVYEVVGVLEPTGTAFDWALFTNLRSTWIKHAHDKRAARADIPLTTYDDLTDADRLVTAFMGRVVTRPGQETSAMLPSVFETIRREGFTIANPGEQIRRLLGIVGSVDQVLVAMAVVVLVASAAGILLALVSSMEQRRRQVAVLRVLGASRSRIFGLVMTESAAIGLVGALVGVAGAWLGVGLISRVMAERTGLAIDAGVGLTTGALVVLVAVLISQAAGLIPALMAYRTSVVRALRPIG
ncbi:MAG: FtsX-like permease family protein [Planctomycetota bacterium]